MKASKFRENVIQVIFRDILKMTRTLITLNVGQQVLLLPLIKFHH